MSTAGKPETQAEMVKRRNDLLERQTIALVNIEEGTALNGQRLNSIASGVWFCAMVLLAFALAWAGSTVLSFLSGVFGAVVD